MFITPTELDINELLNSKINLWNGLNYLIQTCYDTDRLWNSGGKNWKYEYKYRRGGKTLCTFYIRNNEIGCMIILGRTEREKFEIDRNEYTVLLRELYDKSTTYHDGKWIMIPIDNEYLFNDIIKLLMIKRKPNRN